MSSSVLHTPLEIAGFTAHTAHTMTSNTLTEYTKPARLEPKVLIDKTLISSLPLEMMVALEQTMLSVFCGLYLMAVSMTVKVGDIVPLQILSQFSTNRDLILAAGNSVYWAYEHLATMGMEDLTYLPSQDEIERYLEKKMNNDTGYGLEFIDRLEGATAYLPVRESNLNGDIELNKVNVKETIDVDKTIHNIIDESNLVVGKLLSVPISYGDKAVSMQTSATLRPMGISGDDLVTIFRHNSKDISWMARWHAMRSGEIDVKDWLLNMDIIEDYRKGLYADKTGVLMNLKSTRSKNIWAAIISGRASPNAISAMMFLSKETAMNVQHATGYKFANYHDREKMFEGTACAWFIVADPIRETFSIYSRGVEDVVDSSFTHIKGNAKNAKGVDINQVLESYKLGKVSGMLN
jgi:hypothetical protein